MDLLLQFVSQLLSLYLFILVVTAVLSWLVAFNVVNTRNPVVTTMSDILYRLTEPALRPIRRYIPNVGGLDMSFLALFILIQFIQFVILGNLIRMFRY